MIDAHQHFWQVNRADCKWPTPELAAIYRDFTIHDYLNEIAGLGISGTILVQSQPCASDTEFLLKVAAESTLVKAVVGWADLKSKHFDVHLTKLMAHSKFRGLRPMLQGIGQSDWILNKDIEPAIKLMVDKKIRFDALIQPRHLPFILQLVERFPELKIVLDHGAKPNIAANEFDTWAKNITALATHPYVYCKLSGLVTESTKAQWAQEDVYLPYIAHLYQCFGSARLMWGSDWPVVNLAMGMKSWLLLASNIVNKLMDMKGMGVVEQEKERQMLFHATSSEFYLI